MLALTLSFLAATFILGPDLLSRWVQGFVVPRRSIAQNRGEEVTRAIIWAAAPLAIVLLWVKVRHVLNVWGTWNDVQTVASGLYSTPFFDSHRQEFFQSFARVAGMSGSLLWRLYVIVVIVALVLNLAILRYRWLRSNLKGRWAKSVLATLILPRVSEWHILLSDMLLPKADVSLAVDVLTKSGNLYQGGVQDRMLAADGTLQTLTLSDPKRFLRDDFRKAKDEDTTTRIDAYWRPVPGKLFVILGSDIASVNVRYPPRAASVQPLNRSQLTQEDVDAVRRLLSKLADSETPRQS